MGHRRASHGIDFDGSKGLKVGGWDKWDKDRTNGTFVPGQNIGTIGTGQGHPL